MAHPLDELRRVALALGLLVDLALLRVGARRLHLELGLHRLGLLLRVVHLLSHLGHLADELLVLRRRLLELLLVPARPTSPLIVGEVALVIVLTIGAGLLLRSLQTLLHIEPGFAVERTVAMEVFAPSYRLEESVDIERFFGEVLASVRAAAGVETAGLIRPMPLAPGTFQGENFRFQVVGRPAPAEGQEPAAVLRFASDGLFEAIDDFSKDQLLCMIKGCDGAYKQLEKRKSQTAKADFLKQLMDSAASGL